MIISINPATGQQIKTYELLSKVAIDNVIDNSARAQRSWRNKSYEDRAELLRTVAKLLRQQKESLARLITLEMGKLIGEAKAEIEKCAWVCDYYADNGKGFLSDEIIESDAGRSMLVKQPLGTILAVMPWNFPFWQVFRCAAPALMAGNNILLKHASNVPGCALAIENLFADAGFPASVFSTLLISSGQVADVIADRRVHAVSLTGSEEAGRSVAATAGRHLKKILLELGGSDAFVILEDADIEAAVTAAVQSRFLNNGQSCIAAKRFIAVEAIADTFVDKLCKAIEKLECGNPLSDKTSQAPMAREDLRDELHQQVNDSIEKGAELLTGGVILEQPGWFYSATLLDHVTPGMPAYSEETFGPVAAVIRTANEEEALNIANDSSFGLGGSVWTSDQARGERFAREMECGCAFVNGVVKSDPRLPFGGIKNSGYGRELSLLGIQEFVNAKTLWIK